MADENRISVKIDYDECKIRLLREEEEVADICFRWNPLHNQNCYLDTDFEGRGIYFTGWIFEEITRKMDKSLQVMLSSEERNIISILESAGFVCKRKCYEVEAGKADYVGEKMQGDVLYSFVGEEIYEQCGEMMLDRYIMTHKDVNPWTGSKEAFFAELPDCVAYFCADEKITCFAFIEQEEIAYVYGKSVAEFRMFAQILISEMLKQYETILFEADDCDDVAMELKGLFINQEEKSFDTYILPKKEL